MMIRKTLLLFLVLSSVSLSGQEKSNIIIVTGKPLTPLDSIEIKRSFFKALQEKTAGNIDQAAVIFRGIIDKDPQNSASLYELGNISLAQNLKDDAGEYARRAVTLDPDNKWYWLLLSEIYKKNNSLEDLIPVFNELIRLEPDKEGYYFDKANALSLLNKYKEAEEVYKEIESRFGLSEDLEEARNKITLSREEPHIAIQRLEKLIKKDSPDIDNYLNLAQLYIKQGQFEKAHDVLKKAQKKQADNSFIHLLLSDVYQAAGRRAEAFEETKKAFSDPRFPIDIKVQIILSYFSKFKDPVILNGTTELACVTTQAHSREPKAHALYGDILFQGKKFEEAKQAYKKALSLNNKVYLIWAQLLQIEISQNNFKEAIQDGDTALNIFPHEPDLYFFTATAYAQVNDHQKAVNYLKNALSINPKKWIPESDIFSSLGNSLNSLKRFKESDDAFNKSLELNPDNVYTLNNYAYYLSLREVNLEKAAEMAQRANDLKPGNASFEDTYAWVLFMQKKYADARIWIEKAIKDNSNSAVQYEHYGDILFYLGETDQAVQQWKKAKDKGIISETLEKKINEKKYYK